MLLLLLEGAEVHVLSGGELDDLVGFVGVVVGIFLLLRKSLQKPHDAKELHRHDHHHPLRPGRAHPPRLPPPTGLQRHSGKRPLVAVLRTAWRLGVLLCVVCALHLHI